MSLPYWHPMAIQPSRKTVCQYCQTADLYWNWNFRVKEPMLTDKHGGYHFCAGHGQDVFPGWCKKCNAPELMWIRKAEHMELTEPYGLPHTCEQDHTIESITNAECKYCKTPGLLWVDANGKYTLVNATGDKHVCEQYTTFANDWKEAKRMDYAIEKKWVKSFPDDTRCKKCDGKTYTTRLSRDKRQMAKMLSDVPVVVSKSCKKCKRIGTFTKARKADYLRMLRKRYWPFNGAYHKWKKSP